MTLLFAKMTLPSTTEDTEEIQREVFFFSEKYSLCPQFFCEVCLRVLCGEKL